ncbi:hypothetical protein Nepgr_007806 [Nepenthes gracilis]|uniref:Uncharacterized protein n=1 Tax=Nepenthes gracilis TaxID=150966 RepID=A0AAD3S7Z2_NEPGR|nr:hypothetical protein Nepgr_007806 [Nepenthes gracilis]
MNTFDLCLAPRSFKEGLRSHLPKVNKCVLVLVSLALVGASGFNLVFVAAMQLMQRCRCLAVAGTAYPPGHKGVSMDGGSIFLLRFLSQSPPMEVLRDYEANCIDFVMPWSLASFVLMLLCFL